MEMSFAENKVASGVFGEPSYLLHHMVMFCHLSLRRKSFFAYKNVPLEL